MKLEVKVKVFTNTSYYTFGISLDLPLVPTDASEANSTWRLKDFGSVSIDRGHCVAARVPHAFPKVNEETAYKNQLHLANRDMDHRDLSGRVVAGEYVLAIVLGGFFGSDGGIRETGLANLDRRFGISPDRYIEWSIEPNQSYQRSLDDYPKGDGPTPSEKVRHTA